jgi:putative MATE family efflux protein
MTERSYDSKVIIKQILFLIIPVMLENIFQMSAGLISSAMIGRLDPSLISAQGVSSRITGVLFALFRGISVGATVVMARSRGKGDYEKSKKAFEQTVITGCLIAVFFIFVYILYSSEILLFFTDKDDILINAEKYLKIVIFTAPFLMIMSAVTSAFQAHGNTRTPMYIAIIMNIINIIIGYLLIFGKYGFPKLSLIGAALALLISQCIGALLGLYLLYNKRGGLFSTIITEGRELFKIDLEIVKSLYSTGIPAAFEYMFWQFSSIIMSKAILTYGEVTFAAYQLGLQAELLLEMPAIGVGVVATSMTANAIGKKDGTLLKIYARQLVTISTVISLFSSMLIIFSPGTFMSFFTNNAEIKAIGINYLIVMGFIQTPQNLLKVYNGIIRSAGYKNIPMVISFIGIWLIRVPMALIFTYVLKLDVTFIWLLMAADQIFKFIASAIIFKVKKVNEIHESEEIEIVS